MDVRSVSWPDTAVAIVGVGCRLPGGISSLDGLWGALEQGLDLVGEIPADRFDTAHFVVPGQLRPGKAYTAAGGFLEDVIGFDAEFFGISPKEASRLDPQQRLLLECAVEALDDAGVDPAGLAGSDTAVMMGVSSHEYGDLQRQRGRTVNAYTASGMAACNAANRLSYFFDLRGQSTAMDTACSSALTAVHQACEVLRSGRSGLALAGGVNALLGPGAFVAFSQSSMLSPTGRCRPFSARADGYVRSEGAGVLVLKPLGVALADGDRVHAVIAASGVNADGRTTGLALPNAEAQAALLERLYAAAGISPQEVAYVEAHGTGTPAGDPVECAALGRALGSRRGASAGLPIGSVKSNLGHLEAAAGVAGLLKALLVLRERRIPATLHAEPVSELIDFAGLNLAPVTAVRPLEGSGRQVVGVNSFGFGGANAHVVLAAAPPVTGHRSAAGQAPGPTAPTAPGRLPVVISARTPQALTKAAARWADWLEKLEPDEFYDAAFTACRRRGHHEQRIVVLAGDSREAAVSLRTLAEGEPASGGASARAVERGRVGFVFDGNGTQWVGMGGELLATDSAFHTEVVAVDEALTPLLGWSVLAELARPADQGRWERTEIAQPLLFAVQAGLVAALAARGVAPAAVAGHSVGEVAAAYCAGALDRASACRVVAERSQAQAATAGAGRMAAVGVSTADAERRLGALGYTDRLVVAGVNSARDVTVAGDAEALAAFGIVLREQGVFFRDLGLNYAFHSPAMDALCDPLMAGLSGLVPASSRIPLISTVTGGGVDGGDLDAGYWWRNVRQPVRFWAAVDVLTGAQGCDVLVEIGPHPVLGSYLRRAATDRPHPIAIVPTMTRTTAGRGALDTAQAQLLAAGADLDWSVFFPRRGRVIALPAYPWQRERHWNGSPEWWQEGVAEDPPAGGRHPLLGARQPSAVPAWLQEIEPAALAWLADHKIGQAVVLPAAAYVDIALAAGQEVFEAPVEITGLTIRRALTLPWDDPAMQIRLHTALTRDGAVTVTSRDGEQGDWVEHTRGRVRRLLRERPPTVDVAAIRSRLPEMFTAEQHYAACARAGLPYGPAFQTLRRLWSGRGEVLAEYRAAVEVGEAHMAHPSVLDGALQAGLPLLAAVADERVPFVPLGIETVRCWQPMPAAGLVHVHARTVTAQDASWDLTVTDADGLIAMQLLGCRLRRFDAARRPEPTRLTEVLRAAPLPATTAAAPCPRPAPGDILNACAEELKTVTDQWHAHPYAQYTPRALELNAHFAAAALREFLPGQDAFTVDDLFAAGVRPTHHRLLTTLIGMATRHGLLAEAGPGRWRLAGEPTPRQLFQALLRDAPAGNVVLHGYGVCGRHLAAVLRGDQDPLDLLFSDTDALAAHFYDSAPVCQYHHQMVQRLLCTAVADWPADRPLRILEVGAGTGGLTAGLLPHLPPERTHYTYTDISTAFFPPAQQRFAAFDFLHYQRLDLETDPTEQGFTPGSFDLVVADNVLHATSDLARTLHHIGDLLTEGGHLLAVETHNELLLAPIFGLLDSFWGNKDTDLRPGGPLLVRQAWPQLLQDCGFTATVQTGDTAEPARSDYSVILTARGARNPRRTDIPQPARDVVGSSARRWLVTSAPGACEAEPDSGPQRELVAALRAQVEPSMARTVPAGEDAAQWTTLLTEHPGSVDIVVLVVARSAASPTQATEDAVRYCAVLRALATAHQQTVEQCQLTVWLVTSSADDAGCCPPTTPSAAAAWGAARGLANEHPELTVRRIVLVQPGHREYQTAAVVDRLVQELLARPEDDEVLLTPHGRFVSRVRPLAPPCRPSTTRAAYTLTLSSPGLRYQLGWRPTRIPEPQSGEVVIAVAAAGLNYRDIMISTGLVPSSRYSRWPDVADLGLECAGTVIAVGPDVAQPSVGDRVAGAALGCFGSHALGRADRLIPIPENMTFAEAATLPVVLLTVQHSLSHLARLAAGETILVHGAAGGVGLAALQYAQYVGARVIATAGTPAKRDLLHLLGIEHVLNSRSPHFADHILDLTGGDGVDVVLNSLSGDALVRSLGLLKPHGRFVELGKRDLLADTPLPSAPFLNNLTFFGVDVSPLLAQPSRLADAHLAAIGEALHSGSYRPLPHRTYPTTRIQEAFTCLQHSRHTGKIVVTFDEPVRVQQPTAGGVLDPHATYLVTGGLSGLGAATARHLAARGAGHLVLISRRGADAPEAPALLADLQARGVQVSAYAADVADPDALPGILEHLDASGRRLAGVIHAAMVNDDGWLTEFTDERVRAVLAPKMTGGHLLDQLTRHRKLDFFVVYSSVAALGGNARQAPYVAANLALDALVRDRRRAGLPALAIQWGAISDTGYIHRAQQHPDEAAYFGLGPLLAADALSALDELLAHPDAEVAAVGNFDWDTARRYLVPNLTAPRTATLLHASSDGTDDTHAADHLRTALATAPDPLVLVEDALAELLAQVLQTTAERIDRSRRPDQLGMDSLMGAELTTLIHQRIGCEIAVVELIGAPSLTTLAQRILIRLGHTSPGTSRAPAS
ncbi:MAG: SDR family NAD(P)-dependent oxidoreductase [Pseudonocardiales bacterium]